MMDPAPTTNAALVITAPAEHPRIRIIKWRVREGNPIIQAQVVLVYEVLDVDMDGDAKSDKDKTAPKKALQKLKSNAIGVVKKRHFKEGEIVKKGELLLELSVCVHTTVIKDMCADCGADLRQNEEGNVSEASVPMVHSIPDLKVTKKLAQKLGHDDTRRLLQDRKLVLLVDLDQTVIHTTNDNVPNNIKGIYHFQLYGPHSPWYHTRLRPGTPQFLQNMSEYYELHICTFGARNYAHMIAQLLDPEGRFFSNRILSRDECFNATSKTDNLKALFPNGDSMVCIIDDREDVWNMASNLIQVKPYHFFQHTGDINAPPGLSKHELDGEGVDFKDINNANMDKEKVEDSENESKEQIDEQEADSKETEKDDTATKDAIVAEEAKETAKPKVEAVPEPDSTANIKENAQENTNANVTDDENKNTNKSECTTPSPNELEADAQKDETSVSSSSSASEQPTPTPPPPPKKTPSDPHKLIEIEDPDDYLLYLETILKTIHARFYAIYDETKEIPDLKIVVPKIRSEVLRGKSLVFSGLVPTNMKLEQSRAYFIAKSLGANVAQNVGPDTTHLVAVTSGTLKVNAAKKHPHTKIVNANWLWTCAERWECVDERLFILDRKNKSKQRQPPAHCHSPKHVVNYSNKSEIPACSSSQQQNAEEPAKFIDTINPLLSFSNADLADMNKEFDQFFESDSSSEDDHINIENPPIDKKLRKRKREEQDEQRTRDFFTRSSDTDIVLDVKLDEPGTSSSEIENSEEDDDDEMPSAKFRRGEELPSDLEMGSDSNNSDNNNPDSEDDGQWNMLGAALEREFLGLDD